MSNQLHRIEYTIPMGTLPFRAYLEHRNRRLPVSLTLSDIFTHGLIINSSSQYVKTGDAFGETANDMKSVRITDDVLVNLAGQ